VYRAVANNRRGHGRSTQTTEIVLDGSMQVGKKAA
jgi:hypothetical protein